MGCKRLDSYSLSDFQRLAGRPHDYPTCAPSCPGCGAPTSPSSLYCAPDCATDHRRRNQARYGRVPLSERQVGMETSVGHSFAPPRVR